MNINKIAWVLVLIIAAVAAWQYVVNKNDRVERDTIAQKAYDILKSENELIIKDYGAYRKRSDSAFSNATATAIQNGEIAKQSQAELNQARTQVKKLLSLLDLSEKETPDSTWLQVSPNYKWGCDSLRRVNALQDGLITQYEQDNQTYVNALGYETQIRDSALQKEREFNASFRQQLADCITIAKDQQRINQPRAQLYAGMAAWGNRTSLLGGGEINLGLKTRSDQFYEIKGAYLNGWWVGVGTKFKLLK